MDPDSDDAQPSTSAQAQDEGKIVDPEKQKDEHGDDSMENTSVNSELTKILTAEEFLMKSKTYMLEYEKHMFLDTIDSDCLVVSAK